MIKTPFQKFYMGNDTGFLEFKKESPPLRPVEERVLDYQEYDTFFSDNHMQQQAARCMDCGVPFCHMGCPLGNMIPVSYTHLTLPTKA